MAPATAVASTIVSPWRTTTAPDACLAILPVSNEISLPEISTETRVTASLLIFHCLSCSARRSAARFIFSISERRQLSGPGQGAIAASPLQGRRTTRQAAIGADPDGEPAPRADYSG